MVSLTILDVGHGNSAVLRDDDGTVVIDGGRRQTLLQFLKNCKITEIDVVLVSHADADHIGGIIEVLLDPSIHIRKLYVNPDPMRRKGTWDDFKSAVAKSLASDNIDINTQLTTRCSDELRRADVRIEVLSPSPVTALGGVGGQDLDGAKIIANSMSAVIRISVGVKSRVLLASDIDARALEDMVGRKVQLAAQVMVYPHHGGLAGQADISKFVTRLCQLVEPSLVVFSVGRGEFENPRPKVVAAVLDALPNVHIACTQLSKACAADLPSFAPDHVDGRTARGAASNQCCAGTLEITLDESCLGWRPIADEHLAFVATVAPNALCRRVLMRE